jgi:PKD repeat protein
VTLTVSNTNGTDQDTQRIMVVDDGEDSSPQAQIAVDTPNPVPLDEPVILDGSGSSSGVTYQWELSPAEGGATLSNTNSVSSTFTTEEPGWYTVTLEVDNGVATDSDTRQILAGSAEDLSPQAQISVEPSNPVPVDKIVTLSSEESSQGAGSKLTYAWSLLSPDDNASLSSSTDASPTFTADAEGWYTVTLEVDNGIATDSDTKQVLASSSGDVSPQAQIEATSRVQVDKLTTLDGSGSSSGGSFDLTYSWRVTPDSGEVTSPDALSTTFTAHAAGRYTITLEVDNGILTDRDTHHIQAWRNYEVYLPLVMKRQGSGDE